MRNAPQSYDPYEPPIRTKNWRYITDDYGSAAWYKSCPKCKGWLLATEGFYLHVDKRYNRVRLDSYCKPCKITYDRGLITETEERHRAYLEARRMRRHEARVKAGLKTFPQKGRKSLAFPTKEIVASRDPEKLPIDPIRDWVLEKERQYGGAVELAKACGQHERAITRIKRREFEVISFAMLDELLTQEGSTFIWDLYPDEYEAMLARDQELQEAA